MQFINLKIVSYVFIILSAWFLASATINFQQDIVVLPKNTMANFIIEKETQTDDYTQIIKANLFGGMAVSPQKFVQKNTKQVTHEIRNTGDIPVSSLDVKLVGTIIDSNNNKNNRAIIVNGSEQKLYALSENIANWKIEEITREEVFISQAGKKEKLLLRSEEKIIRADVYYTLSKQELMNLFGNISTALQYITLVSYNENNVQGLKIHDLKTGSYFDELALMSGDVLVQCDEFPLLSYNDLTKLTQLATKDTFMLKIYRQNKYQLIQYTLK